MAPELSSESQDLLERIGSRSDPPKTAIPVEEFRRNLEDMVVSNATPASVETKRDTSINGPGGALPVRVYRPDADSPLPIIVYYHGGGWVAGNLESHDALCSHLATTADCLVMSVDYRRPPEYEFPAAVADALAAADWAEDYADTLGGDPESLIVSGDSAGGHLAAAVALLARDAEGPVIDSQILIYPMVNDPDQRQFESYTSHDGFGDTMEGFRWSIDQFIRHEADRFNPVLFPLEAADLSGLPQALVLTCEYDIYHDEGEAYADRLERASVPVEYRNYEHTFHPFLCFPTLDVSRDALAAIANHVDDRVRD